MANSESWNVVTTADVATNDVFTVATPGMPAYPDEAKAEVAINDIEVDNTQVTIAIAGDGASVDITNLMDVWPTGTRVYLYVPSKGVGSGTMTGSIEEINATLQDHEARISALEAASPLAEVVGSD